MKNFALALLLSGSLLAVAHQSPTTPAPNAPAQEGRRGGQGRGGFGRWVGGTIQSVNGDTITLTTRDGSTATVKISSDTRFMREGAAAKQSDFKVGDRVMVRGESTGENTWKAEMVGTPRMMGPGEGQAGPNAANMERMREGMGKEFIAGQVKAIDGTKLTISAPDGKDYNIEVDENTSFRKGRESITFPDIKVGDRVMGRGKLNSAGVFVPETMSVGGFGMANGRGENRDRSGSDDPKRPAPPKQ